MPAISERDPFRIPVTVVHGQCVWELWGFVLDSTGELLGFAASEDGANSICSLPGKAVRLSVVERSRAKAGITERQIFDLWVTLGVAERYMGIQQPTHMPIAGDNVEQSERCVRNAGGVLRRLTDVYRAVFTSDGAAQ